MLDPDDCGKILKVPIKAGDMFYVACFTSIYKANDGGEIIIIGDIMKCMKSKKKTSAIKMVQIDAGDFFYYQGTLMFHSGKSIVKVKDYCPVVDILCMIFRNGVINPTTKVSTGEGSRTKNTF